MEPSPQPISSTDARWGIWAASGFGELHEIRQVLFWSMWLFLGLQIIFASFFLSMLGISRETFIGDYDLK